MIFIYRRISLMMVMDRWNSVRLMAERIVNRTVLVWWRYLRYFAMQGNFWWDCTIWQSIVDCYPLFHLLVICFTQPPPLHTEIDQNYTPKHWKRCWIIGIFVIASHGTITSLIHNSPSCCPTHQIRLEIIQHSAIPHTLYCVTKTAWI